MTLAAKLLAVWTSVLSGCLAPITASPANAKPLDILASSVLDVPGDVRHTRIEGEIDQFSLRDAAKTIITAAQSGGGWVQIDIDSPGGEVWAGMAFVATMRAAERRGVSTYCRVDGWAASMAAVILENCTVRVMTKRSAVLFHEPALTGGGGTEHDMQRDADALADMGHMLAIAASHRLNISLEEYKKRTHGRDWWLSAQESLAVGAVDTIL